MRIIEMFSNIRDRVSTMRRQIRNKRYLQSPGYKDSQEAGKQNRRYNALRKRISDPDYGAFDETS